MKKRTPFKNANILLPALAMLSVLLASCENNLGTVPRKNTGGGTSKTRPQKAQRIPTR